MIWPRLRQFAGRRRSRPRQVAMRDLLADAAATEMRQLAERYTAGAITWEAWVDQFWDLVHRTHTAQFLLANGGQPRLPEADIRRLEALLERQLGYVRRLVEEAAQGVLSPAEIAARAELYASTSVTTYEQALAGAHGIDLPVYPADYGTPCRGNCRCHWAIEEFPDRWEATWVTSGDERVCEGCAARGNQYAPYIVPK